MSYKEIWNKIKSFTNAKTNNPHYHGNESLKEYMWLNLLEFH